MRNEYFCQEITDEAYLLKLKSLLKKEKLEPYYDVINYMIDKRIRLEQESFYNL